MAGLLCCTTCRRPSPELPNVRYASSPADNSRVLLQRSRVPQSMCTVNSTESEDRHELRRIFASSQEQSGHTATTQRDGYLSGSTDSRRRQRSSASRLHDVLRKRLSRDSIFSTKSSKRKSKFVLSEEDVERRKELKRALHRRLKDELLKDRAASQGGYDTDAEIIKTPRVTTSRSGGAIRISPKKLSDLMRTLESSQSAGSYSELCTVPKRIFDPGSGQRIGYEHTNASKVTSVWEDDMPYSEANPLEPAEEIKQIITSPQTANLEVVHHHLSSYDTELSSPLEASSTTMSDLSLMDLLSKRTSTVPAIDQTEVPVSPDLLPLRMPSITESVQRDWRLTAFSSQNGSMSTRTCALKDGLAERSMGATGRPSFPEDWHHEAVGLLDSFGRWKGIGSINVDKVISSPDYTHSCDPTREERDFGGVDGGGSYIRTPEGLGNSKGQGIREAGSDAEVFHEKDFQQTLPFKSLTSAISLPQMPRHSRQKSSGNYSRTYSIGEYRGRYSASSGRGPPVTNGSMLLDNASSVYTYQGESYASSPRDSVSRFGNIPDRLKQPRVTDSDTPPFYSWNTSFEASATNLAQDSREMVASRRRTIDTTSFQSSTDSFRARELAAAATRIVPKPRTLTKPKTSRFKEELEEDNGKVKSLGRKTMLGKGFAKRGSFRSYDGSEEWYSTGKRQGYGFSFVPEEGESAVSMWERALKEHAEEAANTPVNRPGSISQVFGGRSLRARAGGSKKRIKLTVSPGPRSNSTPGPQKSLQVNMQTIRSASKPVTSAIPENNRTQPSPTRSTASWSKYPSHTRRERSSTSAGEADEVISHDFGAELVNDSPKHRTSFLSRRKKSRSMTFGKSIFKSWSKLYKSQSSNDIKYQARGFNVSMVPGSVYEYPELAVLCSKPALHYAPYQRAAKDASPEPEKQHLAPVESDDAHMTERSAKAWSKLYEDCVKHPNDTDTEEASVRNVAVSHLHPGASTSRTVSHTRDPSSNSGADIRESTIDFQRSLRIHEIEAKEKVLRAAEKAWEA